MLNRTKLMLSALTLCFAVATHAQSGANNSVVIFLCDTGGWGAEDNSSSVYTIVNMDPPDFSAVDVQPGDDCAISIAKMNHYGWRIDKAEFDDNLFRPEKGQSCKKGSEGFGCFFETLGVTFKK